LSLPATGTATSSGGKNSQPTSLQASAYNSSTKAAVNQTFNLQAEPSGNDTSSPSGKLNLLFASGSGSPAETGLSIASSGKITFATGQTFPGTGTITGVTTASGSGLTGGGTTGTLALGLQKTCASNQVLQWNGNSWVCATLGTGTITSVTAGTDLMGGGTSGTVTLNLDTTKVPQLNTANNFIGNQSVTGNVSATNQLISTVATGTAPLSVNSTTQVSNLNASLIGGLAASAFALLNAANTGYLSATSVVSAGGIPGGVTAPGTIEVDAAAANNGGNSPGLSFAGGGEDIISNRAGTTNQYGIDFFTNYIPRMSITNTGVVGIGTQSPGATLDVEGSSFLPPGIVGVGFSQPSGSSKNGGNGVTGVGGDGDPIGGVVGGYGIQAFGGNAMVGIAGSGVWAQGGSAGGAGSSGDGIDAYPGPMLGGYAGNFQGDVLVTGNLSKGGGSFKIDHPLDPANKYLYHSFVESPDMKNIYDGLVILDGSGEAAVKLPEWFEALNRDFRYQLTCIGGFAPVYIAEEISNNQFKIAGGKPGLKVSWQVTGIRQDAWANAHRIPVEVDKLERERGYYIHPELYGAPEEKQIEWTRHPEMMKQMKQMREKAAQKPGN
jgi:hypothetical protein